MNRKESNNQIFLLTRYKALHKNLLPIDKYDNLKNPNPKDIDSDLLLQVIIYIEYTAINKYLNLLNQLDISEDKYIESIKNKLKETLFNQYDFAYSKKFINQDFCQFTKQIKTIISNYEKKISNYFKENLNKSASTTEKYIKENFKINLISNKLEYITLEPIIEFFMIQN